MMYSYMYIIILRDSFSIEEGKMFYFHVYMILIIFFFFMLTGICYKCYTKMSCIQRLQKKMPVKVDLQLNLSNMYHAYWPPLYSDFCTCMQSMFGSVSIHLLVYIVSSERKTFWNLLYFKIFKVTLHVWWNYMLRLHFFSKSPVPREDAGGWSREYDLRIPSVS